MEKIKLDSSAINALNLILKDIADGPLVFSISLNNDNPNEISGIGIYCGNLDAMETISANGLNFLYDEHVMKISDGHILSFESGKFFWALDSENG